MHARVCVQRTRACSRTSRAFVHVRARVHRTLTRAQTQTQTQTRQTKRTESNSREKSMAEKAIKENHESLNKADELSSQLQTILSGLEEEPS